LPDAGQSRKATGKEDRSSAAKKVVEGDSQPLVKSAYNLLTSFQKNHHRGGNLPASNKRTAEIRSRVDETHEPRVSRAVLIADTKLLTVEDLSAIDDGLV
jgi:hypothetical protein